MWNFTILHEWGHSSSTVHNISPFPFSFYQMKSHSECHQMRTIRGGWYGYYSCAPDVGTSMTQLIRKGLDLVCFEINVLPQHVIMRRTAGALQEEWAGSLPSCLYSKSNQRSQNRRLVRSLAFRDRRRGEGGGMRPPGLVN